MILYRATISKDAYLEVQQDEPGQSWWYRVWKKGYSPVYDWSPTLLGAKRLAKCQYRDMTSSYPYLNRAIIKLKWELIQSW